jgi:hypothetical protein
MLGSSCFCMPNAFINFLWTKFTTEMDWSITLSGKQFPSIIPSTVSFIASDAVLSPFQISISDYDSSPEFRR